MKHKNGNSITSNIFDVFNTSLMILLCMTMLYPFIYVISLSLGGGNDIMAAFDFTSRELTLKGYQLVFGSRYIMTGFVNTLVRVGMGTLLSIIAVLFAAYPLSKKYFPNRNFWTLL